MHLSHLYVKPDEQDHSIGSLTMAEIIKLAARAGLPIRLGALKRCRSNTSIRSMDARDTYYERPLNSEQGAEHLAK